MAVRRRTGWFWTYLSRHRGALPGRVLVLVKVGVEARRFLGGWALATCAPWFSSHPFSFPPPYGVAATVPLLLGGAAGPIGLALQRASTSIGRDQSVSRRYRSASLPRHMGRSRRSCGRPGMVGSAPRRIDGRSTFGMARRVRVRQAIDFLREGLGDNPGRRAERRHRLVSNLAVVASRSRMTRGGVYHADGRRSSPVSSRGPRRAGSSRGETSGNSQQFARSRRLRDRTFPSSAPSRSPSRGRSYPRARSPRGEAFSWSNVSPIHAPGRRRAAAIRIEASLIRTWKTNAPRAGRSEFTDGEP